MMKNVLCFATVTVVTLLLVACSSKKQSDGHRQEEPMEMAGDDHSAHADMQMGAGEPTDASIYNVSSAWKTRYGNTIKLDSLRGKVQVVAMVYTYCEHACPRILADMERIEGALNQDALAKARFTIVSIDPARDSPQRRRHLTGDDQLSDNRWTLLTGDQGGILELAALLGFKYKRVSQTDFTHSKMITVLHKEREVTYQRNKLLDKP